MHVHTYASFEITGRNDKSSGIPGRPFTNCSRAYKKSDERLVSGPTRFTHNNLLGDAEVLLDPAEGRELEPRVYVLLRCQHEAPEHEDALHENHVRLAPLSERTPNTNTKYTRKKKKKSEKRVRKNSCVKRKAPPARASPVRAAKNTRIDHQPA